MPIGDIREGKSSWSKRDELFRCSHHRGRLRRAVRAPPLPTDGFHDRTLERGDGVGGVWYWNRYPGARVDVHGVEYSFSFSEEIEQLWDWTEVMPTNPSSSAT